MWPVYVTVLFFSIFIIVCIVLTIITEKKRKEKTKVLLQEAESLNFNATKTVGNYISFDDINKKWAIPTKLPSGMFKYAVTKDSIILDYSDILDFELLEDGNSVSKGGVGKALAGGLLFGGVGAIVGGVTAKRTTKSTCSSLRIKITTKNINEPVVYISFISSETSSSGILYQEVYKQAQEIMSILNIITNGDTDIEPEKSVSPADEVRQLKELLDIGAITQDEFDTKKKELLKL